MSNAMHQNLQESEVRETLNRARLERAEAMRAFFGGLFRHSLRRKAPLGYRAAPCA
jgi:hypothetical protein